METLTIKTCVKTDPVLVAEVITASNKVIEIREHANGTNQHMSTMGELTEIIANRKGALRILREAMG